MNKNIFVEMDRLHSQWTVMDKTTRLDWLVGERIRLNGLANQLAQYVRAAGGFMNKSEMAYARELLDMLLTVDAEGVKTASELRNEAVKELAKHWICGKWIARLNELPIPIKRIGR